MRETYVATCRNLFATYHNLLDGTLDHLRRTLPQRDNERDSAYGLRLRRLATDACRAILPAATLTNVGLTANARTLEHAISKLMSSQLEEERAIGLEIREQGRTITPTLVKYADHNPYLAELRSVESTAAPEEPSSNKVNVSLVDYDADPFAKLAAALLYRNGGSYADALAKTSTLSHDEQTRHNRRCRAIHRPPRLSAPRIRTRRLHFRVHLRLRSPP